ncbi:hypothetical protein ACFSQ3_09540 [Sphingobacterium corticis]|uniref:Uncharacterized protein n=1 Tax=Sphingobacterium corticis TaxID=1812823 RepID=A0ABW5NK05_9SPHI
MKKLILSSVALLFSFSLFAQNSRMRTNIFGNLEYRSSDGRYKADLKKNIFDDLEFTDNRNNQIKLEKKYLASEYPDIHNNERIRQRLFRNLVRENSRSEGYKAAYKIDLMDRLVIEDNQGYQLKEHVDIFGNRQTSEKFNGVNTKIGKNIHGNWEFSASGNRASLEKNIFDQYIYKDSFGNKIQFEKETWKRMIRRFESEESIFRSLIDQFFYD